MSTEGQPVLVVAKPAEYSAAKGAKKAATEVATAWGAILGTALLAAVQSPELQAQLFAAISDYPWAPLVAVVGQFGLKFLLNRRKQKAKSDTLTVEGLGAMTAGTPVVVLPEKKDSEP